ncbi:hypothetical protein [Novimethylophilus kurashikiensis]|nr:hypothetical protein [Novimethylophilus kurashikiensis]
MDNKYGLGSARVAHAHHEAKHGPAHFAPPCKYCGGAHLTLCPTMNDHFCKDCGRYQEDVPAGYSTGRHPDY